MNRWLIIAALITCACGSTPTPTPTAVKPPAPRGWQRTPPPTVPSERVTVRRPRIFETKLANGLRVVVVEQHRRPIVSVRMVFGQGSAQDAPTGIGATFFAVSLLGGFYEIDKEDKPVIEADSFARKVFYTGGELKLAVGADHAFFGIDGYAKDSTMYIDLLSRAIRRPRCGPRSFDVRRNAMINSLEEVELSNPAVFQMFVERAAFGAGHPYSRPFFGTIDSLKLLGLNEIQERQAQLLSPSGSTLLIVGDVFPGRVVADVRRAFERWFEAKRPVRRRIRPPVVRKNQRVQLIPRTPAASMVVCAARPLSDVRGSRDALRVLAYILGGSFDSRMGAGLRMRDGVSYGYSASIVERRHGRALVACTVVRSQDTGRALTTFKEALESLKTRPPSPEELARAKTQLLAKESAKYATTQTTVATWMEALARGKRAPMVNAGIENVTVEQISALANRILDTTSVRFLLGGSPSKAKEAVKMAGLGRVQTVRLDL